MIKMPKKITVILSLLCISFLFLSCTFMEETKTAKVSFPAGKLLKSNARSAINFEGEDVIEIRLLGDYTETQKITNIKENTKIIFAEVPLEAKVYAELIIYNKTPDNIKYSGKSDPIVVKEGDNILTVYVKAVKNENTENHENDDIEATYTVIHKVQNIDDDNYFEDESLRDKESGKAGSTTNAKAKEITGFTAQAFDQVEIKSDNSTEVIIYYDRELHTLTYEGGSDDITNLPESKKYRFGAKATIEAGPTRTGYTFAGWKDSVSGITYTEGSASTLTMGTEDITLCAQWTVDSYSITYYLDGGSWAAGYTASEAYTYGQRQNLPDAADVSKSGYGLTGWTTGDGTTITEISADMTGDIKLIALWTAGATNYTVHHWQQNIDDDEYTEVTADAQTLAGLSEESTNASANTYEGFTAKSFTQQTIQADGSTAVDIYYDRNTYTIIYDDGVADETITVPNDSTQYRYGANATIDFTSPPARKGYTFLGWKEENKDTIYTPDGTNSIEIPSNNITLYAQWKAITYNIKYISEGSDITATTECESFPKTYTIESPEIALSELLLSKTGSTFYGWYDNSVYTGDAVSSINTGTTEDITLYAKWLYQQSISVTILSGSWTSESTSSSFRLTYGSQELLDGQTITNNSDEITLTATELTGYTYTWKVDGNTTDSSGTLYSSDNTLTITTTNWKKGVYDISVIASNGTDYQSCFVQIKVGY